MSLRNLAATVLIVIGAAASAANTGAQSVAGPAPFESFRAGLREADARNYVARSESRVRETPRFEEMRQHLITLYAPIKVTHSFQVDKDVFDCVPIEQQPSVVQQGISSVASPPPTTRVAPPSRLVGKVAPARLARPAMQLAGASATDRFGNSTRCEARTIPMRRVTLDEITRFHSLREFLNKTPGGGGAPPRTGGGIAPCTGPTCLHKYSVFNQTVNNWGGNSTINVWSPTVNTGANEDFSLTQHWYVGGSGTTLPGLQTVEVGWQNYPNKYGDQRSRLFVYHTADGYNNTGCYNLDCGDFVQTNNKVYLGGGFTNYSVSGGAQYEMGIQVKLYQGNWWIYYQGQPFGYYPGSLFHGGQLTRFATNAQYGTESTGINLWPGEGSGAVPALGFGKVAYQYNLFYITSTGGGVWESLSRWNIANCYALNGPKSGSGAWFVNFYDGGPGGNNC